MAYLLEKALQNNKMNYRNISKNFAASSFAKLVNILEQLFLVPVYLVYWGAEYYGSWLVLTAIPTTLALSNMGLGSAAIIRITTDLKKEKVNEAARTLTVSTKFIAIVFLSVVVTIGATSLFLNDIIAIIHFDFIILACLLGAIGCKNLAEPLDGYWIANNKAAIPIFLRGLLSLSQFIVTFLILIIGGQALHVALATLLISLGFALGYFLFSWRTFRISPSKEPGEPGTLKLLLSKGLGFQSSAIWQAILFQGSIVLIHSLLGASFAAAWGTIRMLGRTGSQFIGLVNRSVLPELLIAIASSKLEEARRLHSLNILISLSLGLLTAFIIIVFGSTIYEIWTQGRLGDYGRVWLIIAVGVILNATWAGSDIVHQAFNQPWRMNLVGIVASIATLLAMALGLKISESIYSVATASLVFETLMATYVLKRSLFLLEDEALMIMKRGLRGIRRVLVFRASKN